MTLGNDFSMSVWIQPDQVKLQTILILQPDNFNDRLNAMQYYSHNGQSTTFWDYGNCSNGGRLSDVGTTFSNAWQHFVFTVSQNGGMKVYKDGILTNVLLTSSQVVNKGRSLWIGGGIDHVGAQFFFDGKIDDIRLYDKELSSGEVLTLNGMNTLCQFTSLLEIDDSNYSVFISHDILEIEINSNGQMSDFRLYSVDGKELFVQKGVLPGERISIPLNYLSNQIFFYSFNTQRKILTGKIGYVR